MYSVSRAAGTSRTETSGTEGKILRRRRWATSSASHPYRRPDPPPPQEKRGWISGIIAGTGKLLSSIFGDSNSTSESSSSSDDDYSDSDDSISSKENGASPPLHEDSALVAQPNAQKSEAKLEIERLLLLETFTRAEYEELRKLIQSRVVDCPTMKVGEVATLKEQCRTLGNDVSFPRAWPSLPLSRKSLEDFPYSMNTLSTLSPGASVLRAHTPDLCNTAIMEAKKWLEEKKLESSSNSEQGRGPSPSSSGLLPNVVEGNVASPVDMAKSYMRARPPWASPSLGSVLFKTPSSIGTRHYTNESSYSLASYSSPSAKELKRNSLAIGSWDTIGETRRVRHKSTDDILEHHALELDSSAKMFDVVPTQPLLATEKGEVVAVASNCLPSANSLDTATFPEVVADESCRNGALQPPHEKAVEINLSATNHVVDNSADNVMSIRSISESEETLRVVDLRHGISSSATFLSEPKNSKPEEGRLTSNLITFISEKSKDSEEAQPTQEVVTNDSACHGPPIPAIISMQDDEVATNGICQNGVLHLCDEKGNEANLLVTNHGGSTNNLTSIRSISEPEETVSAEDPRHDLSSSVTSLSENKHSIPEKVMPASKFISEKNDDLEGAHQTNELVSDGSWFHDSLVPDSVPVQHNVSDTDISVEILNSEPEVMPSERVIFVLPSDKDGINNPDNTRASSSQISSQTGNSLPGSAVQVGDQKKEVNGLGNGNDAGACVPSQPSLSMALDADPALRRDDMAQNSTSSHLDELAIGFLEENFHDEVSMEVPLTNETNTVSDELQNGTAEMIDEKADIQPEEHFHDEVSMEVPLTNKTNTISDELQNGTAEMTEEKPDILPQKKPNTRNKGKKVGYSRRGKGKGK